VKRETRKPRKDIGGTHARKSHEVIEGSDEESIDGENNDMDNSGNADTENDSDNDMPDEDSEHGCQDPEPDIDHHDLANGPLSASTPPPTSDRALSCITNIPIASGRPQRIRQAPARVPQFAAEKLKSAVPEGEEDSEPPKKRRKTGPK
jgi:hypothetical protein